MTTTTTQTLPLTAAKRNVEISVIVLDADCALADIDNSADHMAFADRQSMTVTITDQASLENEIIEVADCCARATELTRWGVAFEVVNCDWEVDDLDANLIMTGLLRRKNGTTYIADSTTYINID